MSHTMAYPIASTSKTEFIISLEDDSDSDDKEIINVGKDITGSAKDNANRESHVIIETEDNDRDIIPEPKEIEIPDDENVPIIEDVEDVDIHWSENDNYEQNEYDDEAEYCMIIEDLTENLKLRKISGDDVTLVEERNVCDKNNKDDYKVYDVDDDDDDDACVVIEEKTANINLRKENDYTDDSIYKRNSSTQLQSVNCKRDTSTPLFQTPQVPPFIPLCEPSTSTGIKRKSPSKSHITIDDFEYCLIGARSFSEWGDRIVERNACDSQTKQQLALETEEYMRSLSECSSTISAAAASGSSSDVVNHIVGDVKVERPIVENVINLIEDECTIPFIVRYRQSCIKGIDADKVRQISNSYNDLRAAKEKAKEIEQLLRKQNRLVPRLQTALRNCKTVHEVEHLYLLCKDETEECIRARAFGLGDSALDILKGKPLDPIQFVNRLAVDLNTIEAVNKGWESIVIDVISKDCDVLEFLTDLCKQRVPLLEINLNPEMSPEFFDNNDLINKYQRFANYRKVLNNINAHCLMAIERGEKMGILLVYIEFDESIYNKLVEYCMMNKWPWCAPNFLLNCVKKAWINHLKPNIAQYFRLELRHNAHSEALEVFRNNVKHLLLEPPLRGETVIGVDPGLDNGCKIAVVSAWGVPIDHTTIRLNSDMNCNKSAIKLKELLQLYECSIIALGNGVGCRKFENLLLERIRLGYFQPTNVKYKVVPESGVSYYSVSNEAKFEYPHLPPEIIGAVAIARRLQDPLSELVKADPKRLQMGMYMKDIKDDLSKHVFNEVAVECVSFCGVDVNVASFELLSKVSGLGPDLARRIIDRRTREGPYTSRSQLKNIDGLGWKQFEQCAGFVKILPSTSRLPGINIQRVDQNKRTATSTDDYDPFDSTIIHPESYASAQRFLELISASKDEIGKSLICSKIKMMCAKRSTEEIAELCNTNCSNMQIIIDALQLQVDYDYRNKFKPLYIPEIQYFFELKVGHNLRGRVMNVTPMGAFIDCGIANGIHAYLPAYECRNHNILTNQIVLVKIISIDKKMQRFKVKFIQIIS